MHSRLKKGLPTNISLTENQIKPCSTCSVKQKCRKQKVKTPPAVSLAKTGNTSYSLLSQTSNSTSWIVDTGATDHMIGSLKILSNFELSGQGIAVIMADGTTSMAKGRGTVYMSGLVLQSILYVPNLTCNLLSMSKINRKKRLRTDFFSNFLGFSRPIIEEDDWQC